MIQTPDLVDVATRLSNESDAYISGFLEVRKDSVTPTYQRLISILKKIIDRSYTDGVDRFLKVNVDDSGNISGYFVDGAKTVEFALKDNNLSTKLARVRNDSLAVRLDKKKRNCQKGIPCKNGCISRDKTCLAKLGEIASPGELTQLRQATVNLKLEQNAVNKPPEAPTPPKQDYETNPDTGKPYTIRELKKVASNKGVVGYSNMTSDELKQSIKFVDETPPEQQQRIANTVASDRSTGNRAINASGVKGKEKRSLQDSNRTWKNLQMLAKFAGTQPVGWGAAAIGAFLLGASIRTYERAKGEYRSHFKESAEEAQEKAANLGSSKNGVIKRTQKNNITFVISAGKGAGSDAIQKELEKYKDSEDEGDNWLANNHHFIPFNLKESGAKAGGSDVENAVNGLTDYVRNFKRGKDQDAVDLAAQIYAYGIQRKQPQSVTTGLKRVQGRYETLIKQEGRLQSNVENLEKLVEKQSNPVQKKVLESRLLIAQSALQKNQALKRNNRVTYAKLEKEGDKKFKTELANKGKNINILAHSRSGQTSKTALEYLARMQIPGEPTGKEVLEQVNLVMLGTPHFGFTENVSKRQRTLISAQDPISTLPVFGEGARQQWVSTVKGHGWESYLAEPRAREAIREVFGYYEDSLLERRRKEEKQRNRGDSYLDSYLKTLARFDTKKAVCKTGKPCKTKSGKIVCIPKSHKCAFEGVNLAQGKTPFYKNRNFQLGLAAAGVSTLMVGGALAGAISLIKHDLKKSSVDFNSIRQPPGGVPDAETFAKYDKLKPGDLIRKNFKSARMGTRSHYAVYVGKDPKTGEHTLIDTGEDWKSRDSVPYVRSRGLTWDAGPNDTEYEKVPPEEMKLVKGTKDLSREEIVERSQKMLYQTFKYEGFESNCEAFARGMVEGKAYSSQGQKVSPLTNFTSRVVTDKVLTLRTAAEGDKAKAFNSEGETIKANVGPYQFTGLSDYAKDKHKMTASQMVDYLEREAVMAERRKWEEKINPYEQKYEAGYLTHLQESQKEATKASVIKEQDKDLVARNTIKPFNRFAVTVRVDKVKKDSEAEDFLNLLGMRSPEEFTQIVEQITAPFGEMKEAMQIELYKNYLLMLFASLNQDLGTTNNDSYWEGFLSIRLDKVNCEKGKPCKTESGKTVCIPKSHKCASESNPVDKKSLAIAGAGLLAGGGAVAAYLAAKDIMTTINTEDISRGSLSVTTSGEARNIKVGKALDSQGATSKTYFAKDSSGKDFIFKQSEPQHYYQAASEVVTSDMAQRAGIKANRTKLIPVDVNHPKKDNGRAVTLHSLVPGKELSEVQAKGMFESVSLSQRDGLNKEIIASMAQHPDLPKIAALDTFTGNWDRNGGNYFYDDKTDSFTAIDLGVSYSRVSTKHAGVAQKTRDNLRELDTQNLSDREKEALNQYTQTLKSLYTNNPPDEIVKNHAKYLKLAGGDWDIFRRYVSVKQIYDDHNQIGRLIYDLEKSGAVRKDASTPKCSKGKPCKTESGKTICIPKSNKCANGQDDRNQKIAAGMVGAALIGAGVAGLGAAIASARKSSEDVFDKNEKEFENELDNLGISQKELKEVPLLVATPSSKDLTKIGKVKNQGMSSKTTFVQDLMGTKYVLKEPNEDRRHQSVSEVIIGEMAQKAGVNANKVVLIPAKFKTPLKSDGKPATLHSIVPGKEFSNSEGRLDPRYKDINIRQGEKLGGKGLNSATIESMATNKDLPKIVALDAFTNNWDRHKENFFYDKQTNSFHAIDLGVGFGRSRLDKTTVAQGTLKNLRKVDVENLPEEQKQGLATYRDTLKVLKEQNPPEQTAKKYAAYLRLTGADKQKFRENVSIKQIFREYRDSERLINELDRRLGTRKDSVPKCVKGKLCKETNTCIPKNYKCKSEKTKEPISNNQKRAILAGAAVGGLAVVGGIAIANAFKTEPSSPDIIRRQEDEVFSKTPPPPGQKQPDEVPKQEEVATQIPPQQQVATPPIAKPLVKGEEEEETRQSKPITAPPVIKRREEDELYIKTPPQSARVLNGIPLTSAPIDCYLNRPDNPSIKEPDYPKNTKTQKVGVVVLEPDGRFWIMEPTNHVGGTHNFAKGGVEEGLTLQQNAKKECREELGLDVDIVDRLGDFDDRDGTPYTQNDTSKSGRVVRYYVGVRRGGSPADAHWESDKVKLVSSDSARKLFSKGNDRRELSVIKKTGEYTVNETKRMKLVEAYAENENQAKQSLKWKPRMSPEEAEEWAKDSDYKPTLYHVTKTAFADSIEQDGFNTGIKRLGSAFGRGVYAGQTMEDINYYANKYYRDDGTILNLKINAKKVLRINDTLNEAVADPKKRAEIQENWNFKRMKYIAKHLNFEGDYLEAVEREKKRKAKLRAKQKAGKITQEELLSLKYDKPEAEAFSQLVQRSGYDAVAYRNGVRGADHFLIFDSKRVTSIGRSAPKYDSVYGISFTQTVSRLDGRGKKCGRGYIPVDAECKQGQGQLVTQRRRTSLRSPSGLAGGAALKFLGGTGIAAIAAKGSVKSQLKEAAMDRRITNLEYQNAEAKRKEVQTRLSQSAAKLRDLEEKENKLTVKETNLEGKLLGVTKNLAEAAQETGAPKALTDMLVNEVDKILKKDSVRNDGRGKRCGKGFIPANAKCKQGQSALQQQGFKAKLKSPAASAGLSSPNGLLAAATLVALKVSGGAAAVKELKGIKQDLAQLKVEKAEIQRLREATEAEIEKTKRQEAAIAGNQQEIANKETNLKKLEEEDKARKEKAEDAGALRRVATSALKAGATAGMAGAALGPQGAIVAGGAAAGLAASKTAAVELAKAIRRKKPDNLQNRAIAAVAESLPTGIESVAKQQASGETAKSIVKESAAKLRGSNNLADEILATAAESIAEGVDEGAKTKGNLTTKSKAATKRSVNTAQNIVKNRFKFFDSLSTILHLDSSQILSVYLEPDAIVGKVLIEDTIWDYQVKDSNYSINFNHEDSVLFDSVLGTRFDAIKCGRGWISPGEKCKAGQTNPQKTRFLRQQLKKRPISKTLGDIANEVDNATVFAAARKKQIQEELLMRSKQLKNSFAGGSTKKKLRSLDDKALALEERLASMSKSSRRSVEGVAEGVKRKLKELKQGGRRN